MFVTKYAFDNLKRRVEFIDDEAERRARHTWNSYDQHNQLRLRVKALEDNIALLMNHLSLKFEDTPAARKVVNEEPATKT